MNYLISKSEGDGRTTMCGVIIPDNFFVVVGLTFKNQLQLKNVGKKAGYHVSETDLPEGHYTPEGRRVDKWSIREWAYSKGQLVYIDKAPVEGTELVAPERDVRPPDVSQRPDHIDIDMVAETDVPVPAAVQKARDLIAAQEGAAAVPAPDRVDAGASESTDIPQEDDTATLEAAGATDEEAMLRAALNAKGIRFHPSAKAAALRKKLESAA